MNIPTSNRLSVKRITEKMIRDNGIHNTTVLSKDRFLSDHYDPTNLARTSLVKKYFCCRCSIE